MTQMQVGNFLHIKQLMIVLLFFFGFEDNIKGQSFVSLEFQSTFEGDTVSFYIEENLIFRNHPMEENLILGITDVTILLTKYSKNSYFVSNIGKSCVLLSSKEIKITLNKKLKIKVLINGKVFERVIDLKKGNFIGIGHLNIIEEEDEKYRHREFEIYQQFEVFWHE